MSRGGELLTDGDITRRGWVFIWALSTAQLVSWGTLFYSFSLFILPMERELGWSKTDLNGALSAGLLVAALLAMPIGRWIDRGQDRAVMVIGSLAGGIMLLAWAMVSDLVVFYAIWLVIGASFAATLYEPAFAVLTTRLGSQYRRAITSMTLVGGFASTVFMPLTQLLIDWLGWRPALVVLGLITLVVCGGIHWFMLAPTPRPDAPTSPDASAPEDRSPLRRALRTPAFWGLLIAFAGYAAAQSALIFHLVPLMNEMRMDAATVIAILALIGPMQVAGRIIIIAFGKGFTARTIGTFSLLVQPGAMLILILMPPTPIWVGLSVAVYGMANGMTTIVRGTIVQEVLGRAGYGVINGALSFPATILRALAPVVAAVIFDLGGGYDRVLWVIFAVYATAAAAFLVAALWRPRTRT
jgi:predicted MFS family arabinose efflux permease